MSQQFDASTDPDPRSLAFFARVVEPVGRQRGTFRMSSTASDSADVRPSGALPGQGGVARVEPLVPRVQRSIEGDIDWALVDRLRQRVSDELSERDPDAADREDVGREIITQVLESESHAAAARGLPTWTMKHQQALARALFDAVFRLGRLQPLLDDDAIENIVISGHDDVMIETADGELRRGESVADSDEQLIADLSFIAQHQPKPRAFSETDAKLHLALPARARLFATAWVTRRPVVVIRRNRLATVGLEGLVARRALSPAAASFLSAVVQSRHSLVVSGDQGTGKTTMLRALAHELPPHVQIGTIETEHELYLKDTGNHLIVHEWQARPGSGEIGVNGRRAGEYTVRDALEDSLRANLAYTIVGEVRGDEVVTMFKCMQSGSGSMSTTHARSGEGAIRKLVTCATQAGSNITREYALNVIAEDIDVIVQLQVESVQERDGSWKKRRWVSEIIAVEPGEEAKGYAATPVFKTPPGGHVAVAQHLPPRFQSLTEFGFDLDGFNAERGRWL